MCVSERSAHVGACSDFGNTEAQRTLRIRSSVSSAARYFRQDEQDLHDEGYCTRSVGRIKQTCVVPEPWSILGGNSNNRVFFQSERLAQLRQCSIGLGPAYLRCKSYRVATIKAPTNRLSECGTGSASGCMRCRATQTLAKPVAPELRLPTRRIPKLAEFLLNLVKARTTYHRSSNEQCRRDLRRMVGASVPGWRLYGFGDPCTTLASAIVWFRHSQAR